MAAENLTWRVDVGVGCGHYFEVFLGVWERCWGLEIGGDETAVRFECRFCDGSSCHGPVC